ncbi:MAG: GNAT family N-acetyltransferase [Phycisphaerae bacterium]|nr:GNAT family N-acetyltransferase [Phycisphaerae bacterium]
MTPTIETAKVADRRELLDMLAAAFRVENPSHPGFDFLYADLFDPTDEAMACHRIIRQDGRIVACVGCYPQTLVLGPATVKMFGIGQVSCLSEYRGRGFMTALMNDTVAHMESTSAPMSWLGGRRDRYAHFGWEVAGTAMRCRLSRKTLAPAPEGFDIASRPAAEAATDNRLWTLYTHQPVRCVYPHETWLRKLTRGNPQILWTASPQHAPAEAVPAAFAVAPHNSDSILEYGGEFHALHALLAAIADQNSQGAVSVPCCPGATPQTNYFWPRAEWVSPELLNLRIHNLPRLLEAYAPIWQPNVPEGERATLVMLRGETPQRCTLGNNPARRSEDELHLDELQMVRLLFGPWSPSAVTHLPPSLRWLNQIFPLPFTVPMPSHV